MTGVRHQRIADALSSDRVGFLAALCEIDIDRFGGAPVSHFSVVLHIDLAQIPEIANPGARLVDVFLGQAAFQLGHLERKTGW